MKFIDMNANELNVAMYSSQCNSTPYVTLYMLPQRFCRAFSRLIYYRAL
jgi:hypothetical protein